jgi:osmotically-inducible protein OsmY
MKRIQRVLTSLVFVSLLGASFSYAETPKSETAGQYVDDSVITTKVKTAIFSDGSLKTLQINVKTYQGVVQLSGFVDSAQSITRAGDIARGVANVGSVKNDLIIK